MAKSELCDRRPFVACVNGHAICADCCNEFCEHSDGRCPTCGDNLLSTPTVNDALIEKIEKCSRMLEISVAEIEMEKNPFASGGFGNIHMAKWRKENVVVKLIKANSEEEKQAVKCEANLTLRLNHPNVIKLFGITCVKHNKFGIVMEKAEHGSLDVWIGKIDHEKLTKIALGIIDGLKYLNSQKVIHRDIKPKNILMFGPKEDMVPKIADFGGAKVIQSRVTKRSKFGDDAYMAPEVRLYCQYGFAADIYSLAMTLFEMFNEQLVSHASEEVKRFLMGVYGGRIGDIPNSCKVPEYLHDVIKRGWSETPNERPTLSEYYSTLQG